MNQNWCIKSWFPQEHHTKTKMVTFLWQTSREVKDIVRNQVRTELLRCTDIDLLPLITAFFLTFITSTWALMWGTRHKTNPLNRIELLLPEFLMLTWSYSFQTVVGMEMAMVVFACIKGHEKSGLVDHTSKPILYYMKNSWRK